MILQRYNPYYKKFDDYDSEVSYDEIREKVIQRDKKCVVCGTTKRLVVHHKDKTGSYYLKANNNLVNLEVLCHKCHAKLHSKEVVDLTGKRDKEIYLY
jgi:5-methylcytosine-specific restriction endonuclease McrA